MGASAPADEQIRAAAIEVLSRDEYARFRWVEPDWFFALQRWFEGYVLWLRDLADTAPFLLFLVILGMVGVAVLLLAHIVWSLRVAMRGGRAERDAPAAAPRRDFAREAALLAERGDTLGACRALQLACLDLLLRGGTVELARHHGNATLRARLRRSALPPALREELIAAIDALERCWFRDRESDDTLYADWQRIHRGLTGAIS
jgi:hypothetical protein